MWLAVTSIQYLRRGTPTVTGPVPTRAKRLPTSLLEFVPLLHTPTLTWAIFTPHDPLPTNADCHSPLPLRTHNDLGSCAHFFQIFSSCSKLLAARASSTISCSHNTPTTSAEMTDEHRDSDTNSSASDATVKGSTQEGAQHKEGHAQQENHVSTSGARAASSGFVAPANYLRPLSRGPAAGEGGSAGGSGGGEVPTGGLGQTRPVTEVDWEQVEGLVSPSLLAVAARIQRGSYG